MAVHSNVFSRGSVLLATSLAYVAGAGPFRKKTAGGTAFRESVEGAVGQQAEVERKTAALYMEAL